MTRVILKKNEEKRVKQGHLWIFSNEILKTEGAPGNGDLVSVIDFRGNFLGAGFYNGNSLIAVRLMSRIPVEDLKGLIEKRILSANEFRKKVYSSRESYRMVFSESDFLPGLIIDRYNNTYILQIYSAGMEKNLDIILNTLRNVFNAERIFTKHDEYFRELEGLSPDNDVYFGAPEKEIIDDGKIRYEIDLLKGQKTGFYFDQCDNREFFGRFCAGRTVLDCFCNCGGFGLHAAANSAQGITFVDSSFAEISNAQRNFALNNLSNKAEFICEDVFDFLERSGREKMRFDIVNLDPPAFAKNRRSLPSAVKGYEKLNRLAMEILIEGGLLFTSSCSHHLKEDRFIDILKNASIKAGREIRQFCFNSASMDHPRLPAMEETMYLKFAGFYVT